MRRNSFRKRTCLIVPLFIITAVSIGLVFHSTKSNCLIQSENGFSTECPDILPEVCEDGPSFFIKSIVNTDSSTLIEEISCPWKSYTSFIGLLSLVLSAVFFLIFGFIVKEKQNNLPAPLAVSSILAFISLLVTIVIMAVDLHSGHRAGRAFLPELNQYYAAIYTEKRVESRGDQKLYYTEFALIVVLFVAVIGIILTNFRRYRHAYKLAGQPAQELELDNLPIISEGNADPEMSRTEEGIAV